MSSYYWSVEGLTNPKRVAPTACQPPCLPAATPSKQSNPSPLLDFHSRRPQDLRPFACVDFDEARELLWRSRHRSKELAIKKIPANVGITKNPAHFVVELDHNLVRRSSRCK